MIRCTVLHSIYAIPVLMGSWPTEVLSITTTGELQAKLPLTIITGNTIMDSAIQLSHYQYYYTSLKDWRISFDIVRTIHLEYCGPIWNPYLAKNIGYEARLLHLDLYSLFCCRQRRDLIQFDKPEFYWTLFAFYNSTTRGHDQRIFKQPCKIMNRVFNQCNSNCVILSNNQKYV